jgi:peptidyl-prolyl cis-trans isomerase D
MTGTLRSTARNPVAVGLMGLLILVFVVIGIGGNGRFPDLFRQVRADSVVSAGGHSMSATDFRKVFEQQKQRFEDQSKQTVTNTFLVQNGFDQQLLNAIAQDEALTELLSRIGVNPGPRLVDEQIKKLPFAFDRVTGKFSETQFTQFLAAQGLTVAQAQAQLTDDLAQRHFLYAVQAGFQPPRIFAAMNAVAGLENRDISYFILDPKTVPQPAAPTDAQLADFMKAHAAQLMRPETRVVDVVRFSAAALAPTVTVDAAAIQKEFDFRRDSLSTPETRSVVQIPVKTAAQGSEAAARLARGEDPNAVAKAYGVQAIVYADKPIGAIADRKLAALAFSLPAGATKGPVQGDLGLAAVKVEKVTPAKPATLESARPKIEADLKQKAARDKAYQQSQAFDDARNGGANLQAAAAKAGVPVQTIGPFAATGQDAQGKPVPELTDKMIKSAFAKRVGDDADLEDGGAGEYYAIKVEKIIPSSLPTLAEARPALTRAYQTQLYIQALRAKADALVAKLKAGTPIGEVAASVGAHVVEQPGMQRIQAAKYAALGQSVLQGVFGVKPGDAFAAGGQTGVYIVKLDAVRPGDATQMAQVTNAIRSRLGEAYLGDVLEAAKTAARRQIKPQINVALARQAIGVDPTAGPKAPGAAK